MPGHGGLTTGVMLDRYVTYLEPLAADIDHAIVNNLSAEEAIEAYPLERYLTLPDEVPAPLKTYMISLHRLNVQRSITNTVN